MSSYTQNQSSVSYPPPPPSTTAGPYVKDGNFVYVVAYPPPPPSTTADPYAAAPPRAVLLACVAAVPWTPASEHTYARLIV
ncbi:hypothetical protein WN944_004506 [Citrus x changshan-huyou]|uniref:Uncharacterized protein n=1 Tax=Citrus x changshan-huyou TaxID=2935761 RepID=A0AAP0M391_9ROSI